MIAYQRLQANRETILRKLCKNQDQRCRRDLSAVFDAYVEAIRDHSDFKIRYVANQYYSAGVRQTHHPELELKIHTQLHSLMLEHIIDPELRRYFLGISSAFLEDLHGGPRPMEILHTELLGMQRHSVSVFRDTPVEDVQREIILRNTNGITPALCNEFNYRVDVLPDQHKPAVFRAALTPFEHTTEDQLDQARNTEFREYDTQWRDLSRDVCVNPQVFAPLVLTYSFPDADSYADHNTASRWRASSRTIGRDQSMVSLAMCAWHTVMVVEDLGLQSAFCGGFDQREINRLFGLRDDRGQRWYPKLFLCIGHVDQYKIVDDQRLAKHENLVNTCRFTNTA
jgi:nitroreductase